MHSAPGERLESDAAAPCLAGPACAIIGALGRSPRPFSWPVLRSCACPARGLIRRFRGFERMLTSTSGMARGVALIVRAGLRLRIRFGRSRARGSFQSRNPPKKLLGRDLGINFGRSEGGSDPLARDRPEWLRMGRSGSRCDGASLPDRIQRSARAEASVTDRRPTTRPDRDNPERSVVEASVAIGTARDSARLGVPSEPSPRRRSAFEAAGDSWGGSAFRCTARCSVDARACTGDTRCTPGPAPR